MDHMIIGESRKRRKRKSKPKLKIIVHQDKLGKYIIINRKKYRIGNKVSSAQLAKFAFNTIRKGAPKTYITNKKGDNEYKQTQRDLEEKIRDDENYDKTKKRRGNLSDNKAKSHLRHNLDQREEKLINAVLQNDIIAAAKRLTYPEQRARDIKEQSDRDDIEKERNSSRKLKEDTENLLALTRAEIEHLLPEEIVKKFKSKSKPKLIEFIASHPPSSKTAKSTKSTTPASVPASAYRAEHAEPISPRGPSPSPKTKLKDIRYHYFGRPKTQKTLPTAKSRIAADAALDKELEKYDEGSKHEESEEESDEEENRLELDSDDELQKELNKLDYPADYNRGNGKSDDEKGMSNFEIDEILDRYPEYLGCISHDQVRSILPSIKPKSRGGFVINTDPSNKPGQHWQAIYFDARPGGENEIDFFDSYGDPIDAKLQRDLIGVSNRLNAGTYLKFKDNRISYQNSKSSNCGWFATKFLIDRFRGKRFQDASGWDDCAKGERDIEKFKHQYGGNFKYIESFGEGIIPTFRDNFPPSVRKYLSDNTPIRTLTICRKPIQSGVNLLLNAVTLGGWEKAKKEVGIDKALHLYLVINGNLTLERNHVIEMYSGGVQGGSQCSQIPVSNLAVAQLLENTAKKIGPSLQRYDPTSNNCQIFLNQVLDSNGLNTPFLRNFISQDVKGVFSKLPSFVGDIAKGVTDAAHLGDVAVKGAKRFS